MLLPVNHNHPEPRKLQRAVDALTQGDVIAYPTDTVYGIGCALFCKKAIDRMYHIKQLPNTHKLTFNRSVAELLNHIEHLSDGAGDIG